MTTTDTAPARTGTATTRRSGSGRAAPLRWPAAIGVVGLLAGCASDGRELRTPVAPLPAVTTTAPTTIAGQPAPLATAQAAFGVVAAWPDGAEIPARHTCDDLDVAPALTWTNVPAGTVELAITLTDLDADFTHWLITGLPANLTTIGEGATPPGAKQWVNDFAAAGYSGPCPPPGDEAHVYLFTVHALNQQLEVADDASASEVIELLNQIVVEQSSISGTYARAS